jgi:Mlc titration factor MtfA (ptsG expression regulator)
VLSGDYEKLKANIEEGKPTIIDEYGATNPAEFFAVATEAFFERPRALQERHPELYEELKRFYRQDPLARCLKLKDTVGGSRAERKAIRCLMAKRHRRESGVYATKDRTKR